MERDAREEAEERDEGDYQGLRICFCRKPAGTNSAFCANDECRIQEFHHSCVGLRIDYDTTANRWYCPTCESLLAFQRETEEERVVAGQPLPDAVPGATEDELRFPLTSSKKDACRRVSCLGSRPCDACCSPCLVVGGLPKHLHLSRTTTNSTPTARDGNRIGKIRIRTDPFRNFRIGTRRSRILRSRIGTDFARSVSVRYGWRSVGIRFRSVGFRNPKYVVT